MAAGAGAVAAGAGGATGQHPITHGVWGRGIIARQQAQAAFGPTIVTPAGLRTRNPDNTLLLADMNRDITQSLQQLQTFMPTNAERRTRDKEARKASIEASIDSAYMRLGA